MTPPNLHCRPRTPLKLWLARFATTVFLVLAAVSVMATLRQVVRAASLPVSLSTPEAHQYPDFVARATRVADVRRDWDEGRGALAWDRAGNGYQWIGNRAVLVFRFTGEARIDGVTQDVWRLSRRDLRTGREVRLSALSVLFNRYPAPHPWSSLSPDGRWLLWPGCGGYCAATLDGSRFLRWPLDSAVVDCAWLGDSRHWVAFLNDPKKHNPISAAVSDVLAPRRRRRLPVAAFEGRSGSPFGLPTLGWDGRLRVYSFRWEGVSRQSHIIETGLGAGTPVRTFTVTAPLGHVFTGVMSDAPFHSVLSLRGDHITWSCQSGEGAGRQYSLWVSRTDGSQMREVGRVAALKGDDVSYPSDLRWLPDERHLSFVYRNGLYIVPIL